MLTKLPNGLLGLVIASLVAAYMSTISTHLNWGASYIVNDVYKSYINKNASQKQLVNAGRFSTVILMALSAVFALALTNAVQIFEYILMFGAGTGLILYFVGSGGGSTPGVRSQPCSHPGSYLSF